MFSVLFSLLVSTEERCLWSLGTISWVGADWYCNKRAYTAYQVCSCLAGRWTYLTFGFQVLPLPMLGLRYVVPMLCCLCTRASISFTRFSVGFAFFQTAMKILIFITGTCISIYHCMYLQNITHMRRQWLQAKGSSVDGRRHRWRSRLLPSRRRSSNHPLTFQHEYIY